MIKRKTIPSRFFILRQRRIVRFRKEIRAEMGREKMFFPVKFGKEVRRWKKQLLFLSYQIGRLSKWLLKKERKGMEWVKGWLYWSFLTREKKGIFRKMRALSEARDETKRLMRFEWNLGVTEKTRRFREKLRVFFWLGGWKISFSTRWKELLSEPIFRSGKGEFRKEWLQKAYSILNQNGMGEKQKKRLFSHHLNDLVTHWVTFKITQNNAFLTALNGKGEVLLWQSAGSSGFRGPRRSTHYACQVAGRKFAYQLMRKLRSLGDGKGKGVVFGLIVRESFRRKGKMLVLRGFVQTMRRLRWYRRREGYPDFRLKCLIRRQRISHNGLRKRKKRRV